MLPLTLLGPQKIVNLLTTNSALQSAVTSIAAQAGQTVPPIASNQILVSAISPDLADKNAQLTYPRVCVYTVQVSNTHLEKFRSFSGTLAVAVDVWFSSSLLGPTGTGIHYYLDAVISILQANQGDWGDGFYFSGYYNLHLQMPKTGGFGFVESAQISFVLDVNLV